MLFAFILVIKKSDLPLDNVILSHSNIIIFYTNNVSPLVQENVPIFL